MSANLIVDIGNAASYPTSVQVISGASQAVGAICDLNNEDTYCNVWAAGYGSGPVPLLIQCSDSTLSGNFTDPTSGLQTFPPFISSGGVFWVNSGIFSSGADSLAPAGVDQAPLFASGGIQFGAFQRTGRYARLIYSSGNASITAVPVVAGFVSQRRTTGSGGGQTQSPGSGSVSV